MTKPAALAIRGFVLSCSRLRRTSALNLCDAAIHCVWISPVLSHSVADLVPILGNSSNDRTEVIARNWKLCWKSRTVITSTTTL
ncbi:hypothetical protein BKA63DRAFT_195918 [Paraphoma chrysanthemicola]|nr:hypothetical protein BKA63DRAFT_195918 [Paraphoma chrysanthemicola]